jgi:hypothetical protein
MALATQLSQYRSQAAAKIASLAARPTLEPAARQELEELTAVLQAALAQVGLLKLVVVVICVVVLHWFFGLKGGRSWRSLLRSCRLHCLTWGGVHCVLVVSWDQWELSGTW